MAVVRDRLAVVQSKEVAVQDKRVVVGRVNGEPAALAAVVAVPGIGIAVQGTAIPKIRKVGP